MLPLCFRRAFFSLRRWAGGIVGAAGGGALGSVASR